MKFHVPENLRDSAKTRKIFFRGFILIGPDNFLAKCPYNLFFSCSGCFVKRKMDSPDRVEVPLECSETLSLDTESDNDDLSCYNDAEEGAYLEYCNAQDEPPCYDESDNWTRKMKEKENNFRTAAEIMQEIKEKNKGKIDAFFEKSCTGHPKKGSIAVSIPPSTDKFELKHDLILDALQRVDGRGTYIVRSEKVLENGFMVFNFDNESFCPLCLTIHNSYGFQYKARIGKYGGFKCWKTNEWKTAYDFKKLADLI